MKIYIAAGHGGKDPGAVANNTTERDVVQKIVAESVAYLTNLLKDKAEIVRVPDELNFNNTAEWINQQDTGKTDSYCIEVHMNSNAGNPGTGTETYYGNKPMAINIQKKLVEVMGLPDRGVKDGNNLKFNNTTNPASCLVEMGFINNPTDLEIVLQKGTMALVKAIYDLVSDKPLQMASAIVITKSALEELKSKIQQEIKNLQEIHDSIN